MRCRSNYSSHVALWRIHKAIFEAECRGYNPRIEAYVKDQMQEYYERLNEELGYSD